VCSYCRKTTSPPSSLSGGSGAAAPDLLITTHEALDTRKHKLTKKGFAVIRFVTRGDPPGYDVREQGHC
jgi:hypothetical protein